MFRVIEPTSSRQLENIFSLRYAILRAPWKQPKGSERDQAEDSSVHALIEDEIGACIATGRLQFNSPEEGQIRYMAVREDYRGQNLGRLILEYLEDKARAKNCRKMVLQARENAVEFYKRMGYTVEEKSFLLFDSIQHYRMTRQLF